MKKITIFFKESGEDFLKENINKVIGFTASAILPIVLSFVKLSNSIKLKIKLPIIIAFIIVLLWFAIIIFDLIKKCRALKNQNEELLNPSNENVKKFHPGDIIILRIEKDSQSSKKLTVNKISKSEILCRNKNGELNSYIPEELLTRDETDQILKRIDFNKLRIEKENQDYIDSINNFYSF